MSFTLGSASRALRSGICRREPGKGLNDWQRTGYGGACPPTGRHRYVHELYALDTLLPDLRQPTRAALEKAMQDHILGRTELIGHYQRQR